MAKRKSCPVFQRPILDLDEFNIYDKTTFDGTESVRRLNKFQRRWFGENAVAVLSASKSFYGRTFVVPYVDRDGIRYWLINRAKKLQNEEEIAEYDDKAII